MSTALGPDGEDLVMKMRAVGAGTTAGEINKVTAATKRANAEAAKSGKVLSAAGKQWAGFTGKLKSVGTSMKHTGESLTKGLTVPIVALGTFATIAALKYGEAMTSIATTTNASAAEVRGLGKAILGLGGKVTQTPVQLAEGAKVLERYGLRGAKAVGVLTLAAHGATIGGADLTTVVGELVAVMASGIKGAKTFAAVLANQLATAVSGNTSLTEIAAADSALNLTTFKNAGLGLNDFNAAVAVFTQGGMKAGAAAAKLRTGIGYLVHPSKTAKAALASILIGPTQLAQDLRKPHGFLRALLDIKGHLAALPGGIKGVQAQQLLAVLFPGVRGAAITTLLAQSDRYKKNLAAGAKATRNAPAYVQTRWTKTVEDPAVKLQLAMSSIKTSMTIIGAVLAPLVATAIKKIADKVAHLAHWFSRLSPSTKKWIVVTLALIAVLGPLLVLLGSIAIAITLIDWPILAIVVGITLLVAALVYCYFHFKAFHQVVDLVAHGLLWFLGWAKAHWKLLFVILTGPMGATALFIYAHWNAIVTFLTHMPHRIAKAAGSMWGGLKVGLAAAINWIIDQLNSLIRKYNSVVGIIPFAGDLKIGLLGHVADGRDQPKRESVVRPGNVFGQKDPLTGRPIHVHATIHTTTLMDVNGVAKPLAHAVHREVLRSKAHH